MINKYTGCTLNSVYLTEDDYKDIQFYGVDKYGNEKQITRSISKDLICYEGAWCPKFHKLVTWEMIILCGIKFTIYCFKDTLVQFVEIDGDELPEDVQEILSDD